MPGVCFFFIPFHPPDGGKMAVKMGEVSRLQKVRSIRVSFHPLERPNILSVF